MLYPSWGSRRGGGSRLFAELIVVTKSSQNPLSLQLKTAYVPQQFLMSKKQTNKSQKSRGTTLYFLKIVHDYLPPLILSS
jgi:hypothetical protein